MRFILPTLWVLVLTGLSSGLADDIPAYTNDLPRLVAHHAQSLELLTRKTIRVESRGTVPVTFEAAVLVLSQSNLIDRIQAEYARSLPEGKSPDFVLQPAGSNAWTFVNRKGQSSEVHEVARSSGTTKSLTMVFYTTGERFFGRFESLASIHAAPISTNEVAYTVEVLAYPHQPVLRFFVRHLGLVEKFFNEKTEAMETITVGICQRLCNDTVSADRQ